MNVEHSEQGDCFDVAARFVAFDNADDDTLRLCHGEVYGENVGWHWHAWVEKSYVFPDSRGNKHDFVMCIDKSNGHDVELPRGHYYYVGRVENVKRYTAHEAAVEMLWNRHFGPWHEAEKGSDDDQA